MQQNIVSDVFGGAVEPTVSYTIGLIKQLHEGQTDQSGNPYATHPQRVADNVRRIFPEASDDIIMAALLHDTIEDCDIDEEYLRQKGYSENCIAMVSLVTKPSNDQRSYDDVIDDLVASDNHGAMIIKIADNMDNLHPERIRELTALDSAKAARLAKRYHGSIEKLSVAAGLDKGRIMSIIEGAPSLNQRNTKMETKEAEYKYYLLGYTVPVRTTLGPSGIAEIDAFYPDKNTGKLERNIELVSRILDSDEVEEITKEDFEGRCAQIFAEKKSDLEPPPEPSG